VTTLLSTFRAVVATKPADPLLTPREVSKLLTDATPVVLLTGDVGYADENGWHYLVDRKKDMIVASGYKVWQREVEDVLYTHEAVLEAGDVGQPDPYRGETVKAYVLLRNGHTVEPDELIAYCKTRLAAHKYPRQIEVVDAIPKTATGRSCDAGYARVELPVTGFDRS